MEAYTAAEEEGSDPVAAALKVVVMSPEFHTLSGAPPPEDPPLDRPPVQRPEPGPPKSAAAGN